MDRTNTTPGKAMHLISAPSNDLRLYKELLVFKNIDDTLATAALATLDRHHWYLAPLVVMFGLFSQKVSDDTSRVSNCDRRHRALGLCQATLLGLLHDPQGRG